MPVAYLIRRLITLVIVVVGISLLTFMIIQLIPGDPARVVLGVQASESTVNALREQLGLNRPLPEQYGSWFWNVLHGDFGRSLITNTPIRDMVAARLPATLTLAAAALLIGLLIALPLGIRAALKPGGRSDATASVFSQLGVSIPDFWLGIMLVYLFAERLQWLPSSGYAPPSRGLGEWLGHLLLPALTAGVVSGAIMARFVRSAMLEVIHNDYVRTARAKGLRHGVVVRRHVLRNAAIPIVTIVGMQLATLMSQIVVVEIVFAWPGLGRLALESTLVRDYTVLQAAVLVTAVITTVVTLLTDLSYAYLDPRVEYA